MSFAVDEVVLGDCVVVENAKDPRSPTFNVKVSDGCVSAGQVYGDFIKLDSWSLESKTAAVDDYIVSFHNQSVVEISRDSVNISHMADRRI